MSDASDASGELPKHVDVSLSLPTGPIWVEPGVAGGGHDLVGLRLSNGGGLGVPFNW